MDSITDVSDLLVFCDKAGLTTEGSFSEILERITCYLIRAQYTGLSILWDLLIDQRGSSLPFSLEGTIAVPVCARFLQKRPPSHNGYDTGVHDSNAFLARSQLPLPLSPQNPQHPFVTQPFGKKCDPYRAKSIKKTPKINSLGQVYIVILRARKNNNIHGAFRLPQKFDTWGTFLNTSGIDGEPVPGDLNPTMLIMSRSSM